MAKRDITVSLLNFHGFNSHIEILLHYVENGVNHFYVINQWAPASNHIMKSTTGLKQHPNYREASSRFSFKIEADPNEIADNWFRRYYSRQAYANIITENCADATQWFLKKYAAIPNPTFYSNHLSLNHLILGLMLPSFIPIGITLPGRIMDNAKFHMHVRNNADTIKQYNELLLNLCRASCALLFLGSVAGIAVAVVFLSQALLALVVTASLLAAGVAAYGFFKSHNKIAAKELVKRIEAREIKTAQPIALKEEAKEAGDVLEDVPNEEGLHPLAC